LLPGAAVRQVEMFYWIYFAMTGMHALHMIIGAGLLIVILYFSVKGRFGPEYHNPVEITGLYWHFVDIVWIFLFPLLYLLGRHFQH
jgi:cytochrome c oxidase subunit 3